MKSNYFRKIFHRNVNTLCLMLCGSIESEMAGSRRGFTLKVVLMQGLHD